MVGSRRSVVTSAMLSRTVFITSGVQHVTSGSVDYTGKTSTGRSVFVIINRYGYVFQIASSIKLALDRNSQIRDGGGPIWTTVGQNLGNA